jgi:hypothetical protein
MVIGSAAVPTAEIEPSTSIRMPWPMMNVTPG